MFCTFTSPAGFYTIQYPADWAIGIEGNIVNILPSDASGAVTISAFRGETVSVDTLRGLIERTFRGFEVISSLRPASQANWEGFQAEFMQWVDNHWRTWLVVGAYRGNVMVLATANDANE